MKSLFLIILFLFISVQINNAQTFQECGTIVPQGVTVQQAQSGDLNLYKRTTTTEPLRLAVHIVRYSNGTNGIDQLNLNQKIIDLNYYFEQVLFQFEVISTDYIDNDTYASIDSYAEANALRVINSMQGFINVYFVPQYPSLYGISSFSDRMGIDGGVQGIILRNDAPATTLPHEMGHYFDLLHTYDQGTFGKENIARSGSCSNWNTKGDLLKGTPADPYDGILSDINDQCQFIPSSKWKDGCGQTNYNPLTNNMMITQQKDNCRNSFTQDQKDRMNETLETHRPELLNNSIYLKNDIADENAGGTLHIGTQSFISGDRPILADGIYNIGTNNERFPNYQSSGLNYKHNNWRDVSNDFLLTRDVEVLSNTSQIAKFTGIKYSKIETRLEGVTINGKGLGKFQDPWFVKSDGTQPGNYWKDFTSLYEPNGKDGATEKGVFLNQSGPPLWNPPYYSVKVDAVQDIALTQTGKTHRFYFQNWGGTNTNFQNANNLETPVVFTSEGATAQANLKGTQLTGISTGFSNSSQRKIITTFYPNYYYHLVYSSSGSVWYERALMNSGIITPTNWQLMNGAKPINGELNYSEAKSPSIDYVYATHYPGEENYFIYIVYQKKKSDGKFEIRLSKFDGNGTKIFDIQVYNSSYTNYASYDCMPVIGVTKLTSGDGKTKLVVLWKMPTEGALSAGFYYVAGFDVGTSISWTDSYPTPFKINTTDANSTNPSIAVFKKPYANLYFHLAYQQGASQIKYFPIVFGVNGSSNEGTPSIVSSGSGSITNISPSITVGNIHSGYPTYGNIYDSPKIVWCTGDEGSGIYRYRSTMISNWSPFYIYGENDDVQSPTISGPKYHPYGFNDTFQFGWSWLVGYYKSYVATNNLSQKLSLPYHGKDFQISNNYDDWDGFGYCVLDNFTRTSAPFTFENKWVDPALSKTSIANIHSGRAGTVIKKEAEFYFAFGDIKLDDNAIEFMTLNDTTTISTSNDLNSNLTTNAFEVNDNSILTYSVFYGLTDSLLTFNSLSTNDLVSFKIEIIDDQTRQVLGTFDNIEQTKQQLIEYENKSYQVDLKGIGNKTVRMRLIAANNFTANYSLSNIYSFDQKLAKGNLNILNWDNVKTVKEYALEQNFPNPFNPSTIIRYQLPQDGLITLRIYDILGSEIATLVNEEKVAGKYEVNFNASNLASGVYIYKIQSGSFTASKKLMLLK